MSRTEHEPRSRSLKAGRRTRPDTAGAPLLARIGQPRAEEVAESLPRASEGLTPWRRRNSLYTAVRLVSERVVRDVLEDKGDVDEESTVGRLHDLADLTELYFQARRDDEAQRGES